MMTIYYKKIGKKYEPVKEYDYGFTHALTEGTHLIVCKPGIKTTIHNVDPDFVSLLAATKYIDTPLIGIISDTLQYKLSSKPFTQHQHKLFDELIDSFHDVELEMYRETAFKATDSILKALTDETEKMLTVPAVRLAYEQFMMVWKLTKENENTCQT